MNFYLYIIKREEIILKKIQYNLLFFYVIYSASHHTLELNLSPLDKPLTASL